MVKKIPHSNMQSCISFKPSKSTTGMHTGFMFWLLLQNICLGGLGFQSTKEMGERAPWKIRWSLYKGLYTWVNWDPKPANSWEAERLHRNLKRKITNYTTRSSGIPTQQRGRPVLPELISNNSDIQLAKWDSNPASKGDRNSLDWYFSLW